MSKGHSGPTTLSLSLNVQAYASEVTQVEIRNSIVGHYVEALNSICLVQPILQLLVLCFCCAELCCLGQQCRNTYGYEMGGFPCIWK